MKPWLRVALALTTVGWGANHFSGLLSVYRLEGHPESFIAGAVGVYALGLIPALVVTAVAGSRLGWRYAMVGSLVASAVGSALLMLGADHDALLLAGRFIAGAATGVALAPGTAWVMALAPGAGARFSTVAVTVGFGGGPFMAGLVAEFAPFPAVLPYALHLALSVAALAALWPLGAPRRDTSDGAHRGWAGVASTMRLPSFSPVIILAAPWVFGAATTSFAVAPSLVTIDTLPTATGACVIGATLVTGVLIQPLAKRLEGYAPGRGLVVGMALGVAGTALVWVLDHTGAVWVLFPTAATLGGAYGMLLVGVLTRVEVLAHPDDRARLNAVVYVLTYVGFAAPYAFVVVTEHLLTPTQVLGIGVLIGMATLIVAARSPAPEPAASVAA